MEIVAALGYDVTYVTWENGFERDPRRSASLVRVILFLALLSRARLGRLAVEQRPKRGRGEAAAV